MSDAERRSLKPAPAFAFIPSTLPLVFALLMLVTISAAWYLQRLADEAADLREHSSQSLFLLDKMLNNLRVTEASQRDYLLTGLPRYLTPYVRGKDEAAVRLAELRARYAKDATASLLLRKLSRWQELRLEELEDGLEVQRTLGSEYTKILTAADGGRSFMRQIEALVAELEALETEGNSALKSLISKRRQATVVAGLALYIVSAGAGLMVFHSLRREALERQRLADQMEHDAFHDALTGVPNRRYFLDELNRSVMRAERRSSKVGVLFIDLDGFKRVNDALGHEAGDRVLERVVERFSAVVREGDLLARLGGDEFAVAIEAEDPAKYFLLADRLLETLRRPLLEEHPEYSIGASIGIAIFPVDAVNANDLVAKADKAMYVAKRNGKGQAFRIEESVAGDVWNAPGERPGALLNGSTSEPPANASVAFASGIAR